jgi:hypothetical protein
MQELKKQDSYEQLKEALEYWGVSETQYMSDSNFGIEIENYYTSGDDYRTSVYKALYSSEVLENICE